MKAPVTTKEFFELLRERSQSFPKRLRQCAEFVAANPDRIALSTIAELSSAAEVQPSAFMRFCQELGFSGFSEMQKLFREEYAQRWPDYETRLKTLKGQGGDSAISLLAEFSESGAASLEKMTQTLAPKDLDQAVSTLAKAQTIHIVGLRKSFPVATYLAYLFEKLGIAAHLHAGTGRLTQANLLRKGDALLAISFAPYSDETTDFAKDAAEKGCKIVALTDLVTSPLLNFKCVPLLVNEIDADAFRTLTATMTIALALAVAVGAKRT